MRKRTAPKGSPHIDMTAMCDVAFLLLSFFITATKPKPQEALTVKTPSSVATKVAPDDAIIITLTENGKTYLSLGSGTKKNEIIENFNLVNKLGLTSAELSKLEKQEAIGMPKNKFKSWLGSNINIPVSKMEGIPTDSANNELTLWVKSIVNAYAGTDLKELQNLLLIKGDKNALYPKYKDVKQSFKDNDLYKFRIVTSGAAAPPGTAMYEAEVSSKGKDNVDKESDF